MEYSRRISESYAIPSVLIHAFPQKTFSFQVFQRFEQVLMSDRIPSVFRYDEV